MKIHTCEKCGHEVKHDGKLDGPLVHRPDGGHEYTVSTPVSGGRKNFGA